MGRSCDYSELSPETESSSDDNLMDPETESGDTFPMFDLLEDFKLAIESEKSVDSSRITKKIGNNSIDVLVSLGMALTNLVITDVEFGFGGKIVLELRMDYKESNSDIWRDTFKSGVVMKIEPINNNTRVKRHKQVIEDAQKGKSAIALVTDSSSTTISLSFNQVWSAFQILNCYGNSPRYNKLKVLIQPNTATFTKILKAMEKVINGDVKSNENIRLLFGEEDKPSTPDEPEDHVLTFLDGVF